MKCDYLIVGSGLTGSVIARILTDHGFRVVVVESRSHLGGNIYDSQDENGFRYQVYGPHYFRTSSRELWDWVRKFGDFYPYEARLKTAVNGVLENWPVTADAIEKYAGPHWTPDFEGVPRDFEEASLSMMPEQIYRLFVKEYTQKQWGVDPKLLSAKLAGRFHVNDPKDTRLSKHRYQGIPIDGYAALIERMLDGVSCILNHDYFENRDAFTPQKKVIYTGPIDRYFDYCFGRLAYRGQKREHVYHPELKQYQPFFQVNNPELKNGSHIRTLEWSHLRQVGGLKGTLVTTETPYTPMDPDGYEYPFPDEQNRKLLRRYQDLAKGQEDVVFCGRLGEYRYYDMDQAISRARYVAQRVLESGKR